MKTIYFLSIAVVMGVPSLRAADLTEPQVAACVEVMSHLEDYVYNDQLRPGSLPAQVETSKGTLSGWRREKGDVVITDGQHLFLAGNPKGKLNGIFYGDDPDVAAGHRVAQTLFRRIHLPDGRTLDLHRLPGKNIDYFRSLQDEQKLFAFDRHFELTDRQSAFVNLAEITDKLEKACHDSNTPYVDPGLTSTITGLLVGMGRESAFEMQKAKLEMDLGTVDSYVQSLEEAKRRRAAIDDAEKQISVMKDEAEKPENQIRATPFPVSGASLNDFFEEARQKFLSSVSPEKLPFETQKKALATGCGGLVAFDAAPALPKSAFTKGVEDAIPAADLPVYKMLTNQK